MADSKENYKFDLGVKQLKLTNLLFSWIGLVCVHHQREAEKHIRFTDIDITQRKNCNFYKTIIVVHSNIKNVHKQKPWNKWLILTLPHKRA